MEIIAKQNCKPPQFLCKTFIFVLQTISNNVINFVTVALKSVESLCNTYVFFYSQHQKILSSWFLVPSTIKSDQELFTIAQFHNI